MKAGLVTLEVAAGNNRIAPDPLDRGYLSIPTAEFTDI